MDTPTFALHRGSAPLLVSLPHDGTLVPDDVAARLTNSALQVPDTDWWVSRLYAFVRELGGSLLVPRYSRYVIDLNRSEDDTSLYPGQNTTGLCPVVQFTGASVYQPGGEPEQAEIASRVERYWRPYHQALRHELQRLRDAHGRVLLWEGHSIKGELPFLFENRLPDLNVGTASGASCLPITQARIDAVLAENPQYSHVVNGRFKGGHITRHYADPANGVEAVQLELAQRTYMDEDTVRWDEARAECLQPVLRALIGAAMAGIR